MVYGIHTWKNSDLILIILILFNKGKNPPSKESMHLPWEGLNPDWSHVVTIIKSTIFYISASTLDEDLTLALAKNFFMNIYLIFIYSRQMIKQRQTYDLIKAKADSLYRRWTGSEYSISREEQTSNGLWSPIDRTGRNIQTKTAYYHFFSVAYGEALKTSRWQIMP